MNDTEVRLKSARKFAIGLSIVILYLFAGTFLGI